MLLSVVEDQWFDRKAATLHPLKLAESLVAFANAEGGTVVIGLRDGVVEGTDRWEKRRNDLMQAAVNYTTPPVRASYRIVPCENEKGGADTLLVFDIEPSERVHANQKDEVFLRVGDENHKLNFRQRQELMYDKGQSVFEASVVTGANLHDLDMDLLQSYAEAAGGDDPVRLMKARSLMTPKDELTAAAVLLFGHNPQRFFPEAYVRVLKYRGFGRGSGSRQQLLEDAKFEGPLPEVLLRAADFIRSQQPTRRALGSDSRFERMPLIPEDAWLEGLVNAAIHRSYSLGGDHIRVDIFADRIEVQSPGRFPGLISLKDPYHVDRFARNPRIARVLSDLNWGQELGEGIRRMFEEMRRAGLADPMYQESVNVHLTLLAMPIDREVAAKLPGGSQGIVALLRKKGPLSTGQVADSFGMARPTALTRLRALREAGLISWEGKTPKDPRARWRAEIGDE
jgi:ATP-dependent DNA helicase RecG